MNLFTVKLPVLARVKVTHRGCYIVTMFVTCAPHKSIGALSPLSIPALSPMMPSSEYHCTDSLVRTIGSREMRQM